MISFLKRSKNSNSSPANSYKARIKNQNEPAFKELLLEYKAAGEKRDFKLPGKSSEDLSVRIESSDRSEYGIALRLYLNLINQCPSLELINSRIVIQTYFPDKCKMFVNGFQSWSRSEEKGSGDRIAPLSAVAKPLIASFGDSRIYSSKALTGRFHSWSYTYFRFYDDQVFFIGSIDEKSGYTIFDYDYNANRLIISKDCLGTKVATGHELLNIYCGFGNLDQLFDEYSGLITTTRTRSPKISGWCSWYNYYTSVSEDIIRTNLAELSKSGLPLDCFQIDDGWQKSVGDWLDPNNKFPSGMKALCEEIKASGFRPGLWMAPLLCVTASELFKKNPGWLLRDPRGKPVKAGYNPGWSGYFYALDFFAAGVQDYLRSIFDKVQNKWGYSMIKLDFLYAAALVPGYGKSRGEIMCEILEFIDGQTKGSITLGCGVPLGPAFGRFDYCRIGSDVAPYWEDYLKYLHYPERVSAENSLTSSIGRRQLDGRMFRNDPDVFLLRNGERGINENRLNNHQRQTLFFLNNLLGGVIFFSDQYSRLTLVQQRQLSTFYPLVDTVITAVDNNNKIPCFKFMVGKKHYIAFANLSAKMRRVDLPDGLWFNRDMFLEKGGANVMLEPFQSICFHRAEPGPGNEVFLLGASGHIFPGAQVSELITSGEGIIINLHEHTSPDTVVYVAVPEGIDEIRVNRNYYHTLRNESINYIAIPAAAV